MYVMGLGVFFVRGTAIDSENTQPQTICVLVVVVIAAVAVIAASPAAAVVVAAAAAAAAAAALRSSTYNATFFVDKVVGAACTT